MRISDWSSDVCSSDLKIHHRPCGIRHAHCYAGHLDLLNPALEQFGVPPHPQLQRRVGGGRSPRTVRDRDPYLCWVRCRNLVQTRGTQKAYDRAGHLEADAGERLQIARIPIRKPVDTALNALRGPEIG